MSGPTPIPAYLEAAVQAAIACLSPVLQNVATESGQPVSYPLRAVWHQERMTFPEVVLDVAAGRAPQQASLGLLDWDATTGLKTYGRIAFGSPITLTVYARSAPERDYVLDLLSSGYNGAWGPDAWGTPLDSIVKVALAEGNIVTTGEEAITKRDAVASAARPEGEYYEGVLKLTADITSTWQRPGITLASPAILQVIATGADAPIVDPIGPVEAVVGTSLAQALQLSVAASWLVGPGTWQLVATDAATYTLQSYADGAWATVADGLVTGTHYVGTASQPYIPGCDLYVAASPPLVAGDSATVQTGVPRTFATVTTDLAV